MRVLEAAELLVKIVIKCRKLDGAAFMLMPPKPQLSILEGYRIHIDKDSGIDQETFICVTSIAKERGLSCFEDYKGVMIYRKH